MPPRRRKRPPQASSRTPRAAELPELVKPDHDDEEFDDFDDDDLAIGRGLPAEGQYAGLEQTPTPRSSGGGGKPSLRGVVRRSVAQQRGGSRKVSSSSTGSGGGGGGAADYGGLADDDLEGKLEGAKRARADLMARMRKKNERLGAKLTAATTDKSRALAAAEHERQLRVAAVEAFQRAVDEANERLAAAGGVPVSVSHSVSIPEPGDPYALDRDTGGADDAAAGAGDDDGPDDAAEVSAAAMRALWRDRRTLMRALKKEREDHNYDSALLRNHLSHARRLLADLDAKTQAEADAVRTRMQELHAKLDMSLEPVARSVTDTATSIHAELFEMVQQKLVNLTAQRQEALALVDSQRAQLDADKERYEAKIRDLQQRGEMEAVELQSSNSVMAKLVRHLESRIEALQQEKDAAAAEADMLRDVLANGEPVVHERLLLLSRIPASSWTEPQRRQVDELTGAADEIAELREHVRVLERTGAGMGAAMTLTTTTTAGDQPHYSRAVSALVREREEALRAIRAERDAVRTQALQRQAEELDRLAAERARAFELLQSRLVARAATATAAPASPLQLAATAPVRPGTGGRARGGGGDEDDDEELDALAATAPVRDPEKDELRSQLLVAQQAAAAAVEEHETTRAQLNATMDELATRAAPRAAEDLADDAAEHQAEMVALQSQLDAAQRALQDLHSKYEAMQSLMRARAHKLQQEKDALLRDAEAAQLELTRKAELEADQQHPTGRDDKPKLPGRVLARTARRVGDMDLVLSVFDVEASPVAARICAVDADSGATLEVLVSADMFSAVAQKSNPLFTDGFLDRTARVFLPTRRAEAVRFLVRALCVDQGANGAQALTIGPLRLPKLPPNAVFHEDNMQLGGRSVTAVVLANRAYDDVAAEVLVYPSGVPETELTGRLVKRLAISVDELRDSIQVPAFAQYPTLVATPELGPIVLGMLAARVTGPGLFDWELELRPPEPDGAGAADEDEADDRDALGALSPAPRKPRRPRVKHSIAARGSRPRPAAAAAGGAEDGGDQDPEAEPGLRWGHRFGEEPCLLAFELNDDGVGLVSAFLPRLAKSASTAVQPSWVRRKLGAHADDLATVSAVLSGALELGWSDADEPVLRLRPETPVELPASAPPPAPAPAPVSMEEQLAMALGVGADEDGGEAAEEEEEAPRDEVVPLVHLVVQQDARMVLFSAALARSEPPSVLLSLVDTETDEEARTELPPAALLSYGIEMSNEYSGVHGAVDRRKWQHVAASLRPSGSAGGGRRLSLPLL